MVVKYFVGQDQIASGPWTISLDGVFKMRSHQSTVKRYENLLFQTGKGTFYEVQHSPCFIGGSQNIPKYNIAMLLGGIVLVVWWCVHPCHHPMCPPTIMPLKVYSY